MKNHLQVYYNNKGFVFEVLSPKINYSSPEVIAAFAAQPNWGIEVTDVDAAKLCEVNIDPQHTDGIVDSSAIEAIFLMLKDSDFELSASTHFLTNRLDPDSAGGMALFLIKDMAQAIAETQLERRVAMVGKSDRFAHGAWTPNGFLPSRDQLWPDGETLEVSVIAAALADYKIPVAQRIEWMFEWLLTGAEPEGYRATVIQKRIAMVEAWTTGGIVVEHYDNFVVVHSTHLGASAIGYAYSPMVIAVNTKFVVKGGEPHTKYTISLFNQESGPNLKILFNLLDAADVEKGGKSGWGGSPVIGGSPEGVSPQLTLDEIIATTEDFLAEYANN